MGYIKDYEGGTLMQCTMVPLIRYLGVGRLLLKQKETVQAKIRSLSKSHIEHQPPSKWTAAAANGTPITPIDPVSIPAIRALGWYPAMDELGREPQRPPLQRTPPLPLPSPEPQPSVAVPETRGQRPGPRLL
jgi:histone acetyltransferase